MRTFNGVKIRDIQEAYLVFEWDYNRGGWLPERPSNRNRMASTAVQVHRMGFYRDIELCYDALSPIAKGIYESLAVRYGFYQSEQTFAIRIDGRRRNRILRMLEAYPGCKEVDPEGNPQTIWASFYGECGEPFLCYLLDKGLVAGFGFELDGSGNVVPTSY